MGESERAAAEPREMAFEALRGRLFGIAYRMLGSAMDAEDIVQEAWLRWRGARARGQEIRSDEAFLVTVTTRLSIDQGKRASRRREAYVGPWLPEPLVVLGEGPAPWDEPGMEAGSLATAFLLLLERLGPVERAAYLLREIFDYPYAEVAAFVERSEAATRQLVSRARKRIGEGRPRQQVGRAEGERLVGAFLEACATGDVEGLSSLLAEDVLALSDGGGKAIAAGRPLQGVEEVARFVLAIAGKAPAGMAVERCRVNGGPGLTIRVEERLITVMGFELRDGRIAGLYSVLNPDKLGGVEAALAEA